MRQQLKIFLALSFVSALTQAQTYYLTDGPKVCPQQFDAAINYSKRQITVNDGLFLSGIYKGQDTLQVTHDTIVVRNAFFIDADKVFLSTAIQNRELGGFIKIRHFQNAKLDFSGDFSKLVVTYELAKAPENVEAVCAFESK